MDRNKNCIQECWGAETIKETHFNALYQTDIKMSGNNDTSLIMSMVGCSKESAEEYLKEANGDVLLAICNHTECPEVSGNKYIPPPPKINDGLTDEVRSKIQEARKIGDMFSASFRNDLRGAQGQTSGAASQAVQVSAGAALPPVEERPETQAEIDVDEC
jgi:hypothetical protein